MDCMMHSLLGDIKSGREGERLRAEDYAQFIQETRWKHATRGEGNYVAKTTQEQT